MQEQELSKICILTWLELCLERLDLFLKLNSDRGSITVDNILRTLSSSLKWDKFPNQSEILSENGSSGFVAQLASMSLTSK